MNSNFFKVSIDHFWNFQSNISNRQCTIFHTELKIEVVRHPSCHFKNGYVRTLSLTAGSQSLICYTTHSVFPIFTFWKFFNLLSSYCLIQVNSFSKIGLRIVFIASYTFEIYFFFIYKNFHTNYKRGRTNLFQIGTLVVGEWNLKMWRLKTHLKV